MADQTPHAPENDAPLSTEKAHLLALADLWEEYAATLCAGCDSCDGARRQTYLDNAAELRARLVPPPALDPDRNAYPAGHGYTPSTGPFGGGEGCRVMLARYPCNYTKDQHDPDLPPVDLDVFGYRRRPRCCPGAGTMAHVRGCENHPEADRD